MSASHLHRPSTERIPATARWLLRLGIAAVWVYQGLWNKFLVVRVFAWDDRHLQIMRQAFGDRFGGPALHGLAALETLIVVAVLLAWRPVMTAWAQIALVAAMNTAGILFAAADIPDIGGMVTMNFVFCLAVWINGRLSLPAHE